MAIARVHTIQPDVLRGTVVTIEADISRGLHAFSVVGLASKAVDESKDRVGSAIKHSGYQSPKTKNQKVVISLSPADLKKEGPLFDLPIAVAYLLAAGEIQSDEVKRIFIGELSLDGTLRPVKGVLNSVVAAEAAGYTEIIVPKENAEEAALLENIKICPASSLLEVIEHIAPEEVSANSIPVQPPTVISDGWYDSAINLGRHQRPGKRQARTGYRCRRAAQRNASRTTRHRQDHARARFARAPASAITRGVPGRYCNSFYC